MAAHRRNVGAAVGELLLAMLGPPVVLGLFALLAVKFGAESRPYFDERPVVDDRPNWFPIAGAGADDEDDDGDHPPDDGRPAASGSPSRGPPRRRRGVSRWACRSRPPGAPRRARPACDRSPPRRVRS